MGVTLHIPTGCGSSSFLAATSLPWRRMLGGALPVAARDEIERCAMPTPKRKRKLSLAKAARLAVREGVEVKLAPDGTIIMTPIKPVDVALIDDDAAAFNEWDTVQ
jgi:hypothetical protein